MASEEDLQAARDLLRRIPAFVGNRTFDEAVRDLADFRHRRGKSGFELMFGLREPTNQIERWQVDAARGRMTQADLEERVRAHVQRPVDAEMLDIFFREIHTKIQGYSTFMVEVGDLLNNPRRQPVEDRDEEKVDQLVREMTARMVTVTKDEATTVLDFLCESRIEKRLGVAQLAGCSAATASALIVAITKRASHYWQNSRDIGIRSQTEPEYEYPARGIELFGAAGGYKDLPRAQDLQAILDEEQTLARMCLRERSASQSPPPPIAPLQSAVSLDSDPAPLLTAEHWSDVAIGIDEHGRYWALTPAPDAGGQFRKSQAVELHLSPGRFDKVLAAFAESPSPGTVATQELISQLKYLPPTSTLESDKRARPGEIEAGQISALQLRRKKAIGLLTVTLSDLRRDLRELISVKHDPRGGLLAIDGVVVKSIFRVAYLLVDEGGQLVFGRKP